VFGSDGPDQHYGFYPTAGRLRLTHFAGPTVYSWQILTELDSPHYRPGQWNYLKVRVESDKLQCFVNDQPVLTWPLSAPLDGKVGLAKFRDTRAGFKRFEVAARLEPSQLPDERLQPARMQIAALPLSELAGESSLGQLAEDAEASRWALEQQAAMLQSQAEQLRRLAGDVHTRATVKRLVRLMDAPESAAMLARAALLVSQLDNPELDATAYLEQLDRMTAEMLGQLSHDASTADRLAQLNRYLFRDNGFHGSRTDYYQAANSHFDRVLDDREGLPITLSILYLELGRRLGIPLAGVGVPGHFMVRFTPETGEPQYIDVFAGGQSVTLDQLKRQMLRPSEAPLDEEMLAAAAPREIILRVLRNLQGLAQRSQDTEALLRYLEAMVALAPDEPTYRGMRAVVRRQTGRRESAIADLDWFLEHAPAGVDLDAIRDLKARFQAGE
jgi:regulator of sirC expression with transglutaminase-like and TPR domain